MVGRLRRLCRRIGFDIAAFPGAAAHWAQLVTLLEAHDVSVVFDVGANAGQYATALFNNGYRGRIVSYEPVAAVHAALTRAAASRPNWEVAPRAAIGARAGEAVVNISAESDMSSLHAMTAAARTHLSRARTTGSERVPMVTLADEISSRAEAEDRVFVKSDTQGHEAQVLDGLGETAARVVGVQLELALEPVYEGQPRYLELLERLEGMGFTARLVIPGYYSRHYGRMLEFDVVAFRDSED